MSSRESGAVALAGLTAVAVISADQFTKALARNSLAGGNSKQIIGGFIQLVDVRNSGVAFGQLRGAGLIVGALVAVALVALLWYFLTHLGTPLIWLATGLVIGGAIGNIIDRVRAGAVTDFIKFPHWPAFNFADAAITIGVVALVVLVEVDSRQRRRQELPSAD